MNPEQRNPYEELLRDPRWQKKRLEIMERDRFTCRHCEATDKTLCVHHIYYDHGREPWDYPDEALITFCEDCHKDEEAKKRYWDATLVRTFRRLGATNAALEQLVLILGDLKKEYGSGRMGLLLTLLDEQNEPPLSRGLPKEQYRVFEPDDRH